MCQHQPSCPDAEAPDGSAAHVAARHPEQGWSLLCNGVVLFDDGGELRPDGRAVAGGAREPPAAGQHVALEQLGQGIRDVLNPVFGEG